MSAFGNILLGGIFHAAVLFLVAAGLQLVFGVQKIVNLACGSFYALGAYFGITAVGLAIKLGMPPVLFLPVLIVAGLAIGLVGTHNDRIAYFEVRRLCRLTILPELRVARQLQCDLISVRFCYFDRIALNRRNLSEHGPSSPLLVSARAALLPSLLRLLLPYCTTAQTQIWQYQ